MRGCTCCRFSLLLIEHSSEKLTVFSYASFFHLRTVSCDHKHIITSSGPHWQKPSRRTKHRYHTKLFLPTATQWVTLGVLGRGKDTTILPGIRKPGLHQSLLGTLHIAHCTLHTAHSTATLHTAQPHCTVQCTPLPRRPWGPDPCTGPPGWNATREIQERKRQGFLPRV